MALGSSSEAQYFGRNKVRYGGFAFQVLKTEHFDIYFYSSEREGVDIAARLAERWYSRLERRFEHTLSSRQPLILYASHTDFEQTNVIPEELDEGTGGVTEPLRRRIVLPLAGTIADTDHVLGHELVHAFQFDMAGEPGGHSNQLALTNLPLWFVEGMAEYVSLGSIDANTAMRLRDAMRQGRLPSLHDLASSTYFPYQWGHAVFAYIGGRYGDAAIPRLLTAAARDNVDLALKNVLGISADELSNDWHDAIRSSYVPVLAASRPLAGTARPLIQTEALGAEFNISPALSPDGHLIAFFSSRGLFSIDLYVADARTGRIVRKLTSTASDPHFASIEFVDSAGAWDPSSERVAIGTIVGNRPALAIFNARTGARSRDIKLSGVDEILNPTWSPDGHAIAFTAMRGGLTDLCVYDLRTASLARITNDAYADLHPAWAPDSRHIVFASDRFSSDLESLDIGALQLVLADTETGAIEPLSATGAGKHINPQWSPDGQAVYFIGDPDGVPNVYRLWIATHLVEQLTAMDTGVSGITPSSPALSVSSGTGQLAIGVLENNRYSIYIRDAAEPAGPITTLPVNAAALPPTDRSGPRTAFLSQSGEGLQPSQPYQTTPYKPKLSLASIGQPTVGFGAGPFGVAASGGASLVFADTLGDHWLATAFQVTSGVAGSFSASDVAFEAAYLNMVRRWNWGVAGGQVPYYVGGGFDSTIAASPAGDLLEIDRQIVFRQIERGGSGSVSYPFDRTRRVEFRGGFAHTAFEETLTTKTSSATTGTVLSETTARQSFAPQLNLATAAVAMVSDRAIFGPTGPIQGERSRLEVSQAVGSINYTSVVVDYRRYVMPVSFYTIAARILHYGRYGEGGDDARLYPVYIDNPAFVRGYDSLDVTDCVATPTSPCQLADRLTGSRILVGNLELRFPLLRPFGVSRAMYGAVPIEVALFTDSGVAWTGREEPAIFGGTRPGISSAGFAVRAGLGGFVTEFDFTHPFERPGHGWVFGFNLIPAW